jgi:hypothetical protein
MYTSKDKVRCVVVAAGWRIEGDVHVLSGSRLTDSLNSKAKDFIAVTDAEVYDVTSGEVAFRPPYVAVNRESIALIFPVNET